MKDAVDQMRVLETAESEPASTPLSEAAMLAEPFWRARLRIAILGECNSGKTALVNALAGAEVLTPSIATPTLYPTVVGFAARPSLSVERPDRKRMPVDRERLGDLQPHEIWRLHVGVRVDQLRALTVVDTPGVGGLDGQHDRRSLKACRNANIVIWCTPAMQAWKASEERAWSTLPARWRARGILAVTFADQIPHEDAYRLLARLRDEAGGHFRSVVLSGECAALVAKMRESTRTGPLRRMAGQSPDGAATD